MTDLGTNAAGKLSTKASKSLDIMRAPATLLRCHTSGHGRTTLCVSDRRRMGRQCRYEKQLSTRADFAPVLHAASHKIIKIRYITVCLA